MPRKNRSYLDTRQMIALEAARIILDEAVDDYGHAKKKAARRLNLDPRSGMPGNREIASELRRLEELLDNGQQRGRLKVKRDAAVEAMKFFEPFKPRLVGAVAEGVAHEHTLVTLHLFADTTEQVSEFLEEQSIPHDESSRTIRLNRRSQFNAPSFEFDAGGVGFEVIALPMSALRQSPLSLVDGQPMLRLSRHGLEALIKESAANQSDVAAMELAE